ncbi:MAG: hypothetical protein KC413_04660, partial [Anaerolineales bacterium]|nr:hypothetical protein [Anaerolineales bacterium]
MPEANEPISAANFQQLTHVAQWGNGSILGVAFAPDGRSFLVGSAVGFNLYEIDTLPRWVPWSQPFFYESASFSTDGQYVLLENRRESRIYRATDGQQVFHVENVTWINSSKRTPYNDQRVVSGDWRFESYSTFDEENMSIEIVVQEMYDNVTGDLLYQFDAETMYVQYRDYHEPEGCDLNTFSMCG